MKKPYEEKAIAMYTSGATQKEIFNELGIGGGQLYRVLEENNIPLRNPEKAKKHKGNKKKTAFKKCPHCKASNNPAYARFCCMCGGDIRTETDILTERLNNAITICCKFLPANCTDEVTGAIRQAIPFIERGATK